MICTILAHFDQDYENAKFFGKDAAQTEEGVCFSFTMKWLHTVQMIPEETKEAANQRMKILRASWIAVKNLDHVYAEKRAATTGTGIAKDVKIFAEVCKETGFLFSPSASADKHDWENYTEIPKGEKNALFDALLQKLMAPGLKVAKLMLSGKAGVVRHMAGVLGKGDRLINFDPNEGEVLFDAEGYKGYLRDHWRFYEESCFLAFYNVRAPGFDDVPLGLQMDSQKAFKIAKK